MLFIFNLDNKAKDFDDYFVKFERNIDRHGLLYLM